ncbi:hypothetical protein JOB18_012383 [Solea senegalensis]|uniref:Uncharacterized protein n=1 Tax=Solea senegalensis TaxID=28829 RepID=A0AAV6SRQ2_SOLSE|nr:hypothetical protein JOB18_012383 [Solea senegalensis]
MGRREADGRGAVNTSDRSEELGCLQNASSHGHRARDESLSRRQLDRQRQPERMEATVAAAATSEPVEVKKHQHKHNLKHRYEVMETLGKTLLLKQSKVKYLHHVWVIMLRYVYLW